MRPSVAIDNNALEDGVPTDKYSRIAAHHHKHTADGSVTDVPFEGLRAVFERFKNEVEFYGDEWN